MILKVSEFKSVFSCYKRGIYQRKFYMHIQGASSLLRKLRMVIIGVVPGLWTARYVLRSSQEEQPKIIHAKGDLTKIS